ncbi:hypothetical protein DAI22_04g170250 [Oryza sativa Japonica Group]|nr:hypothetical protein DAI22_04g170250 [Oryza sativa Japonica Group]
MDSKSWLFLNIRVKIPAFALGLGPWSSRPTQQGRDSSRDSEGRGVRHLASSAFTGSHILPPSALPPSLSLPPSPPLPFSLSSVFRRRQGRPAPPPPLLLLLLARAPPANGRRILTRGADGLLLSPPPTASYPLSLPCEPSSARTAPAAGEQARNQGGWGTRRDEPSFHRPLSRLSRIEGIHHLSSRSPLSQSPLLFRVTP